MSQAEPAVTEAALASAVPTEIDTVPMTTARRRFLRRFLAERPAVLGLAFILLLTLVALLAPVLAPEDPNATDLRNAFASPGSSGALLGTDDLGRDILSRLIFATRVSLVAAVLAVGVAMALSVPTGLIAGYLGGWVDALIMRVADAIMSFPFLILAIAVIGAMGPGLTNAMVTVGFVFAPRLLRLVRAATLEVRQETFIDASRTIGTPTARIIRRHVLPNILSPLVVQASLLTGFAMLAEASLSFLGLGIQPPDASWGVMLERGFQNISREPALVILPGLAIALAVLAFNVVGDGLRDSFGREVVRG